MWLRVALLLSTTTTTINTSDPPNPHDALSLDTVLCVQVYFVVLCACCLFIERRAQVLVVWLGLSNLG